MGAEQITINRKQSFLEVAERAESRRLELAQEVSTLDQKIKRLDLEKFKQTAKRAEERKRASEERVRLLEADIDTLEDHQARGVEIDDAMIASLSSREKQAVAREMRTQVVEDFEPEEVRTDSGTFLRNQVVKSVSGIKISSRMGEIVRGIRNGVLAGAAVVAFGLLGKNYLGKDKNEEDLLTPPEKVATLTKDEMERRTPIKYTEAAIDTATFEQLSANGRIVYLYALTNVKGPYLIIDKVRATMYLIGKDKKLATSNSVLLGSVRTEAPNTANPLDDIPGPGATSPAGKYLVGRDLVRNDSINYENRMFGLYHFPVAGGDTINARFTVHSTYTGELVKRTRALNTPTPDDNHITWGCINMPRKIFDQYFYGQNEDGTDKFPENSVVFVLPYDTTKTLNPLTGQVEGGDIKKLNK